MAFNNMFILIKEWREFKPGTIITATDEALENPLTFINWAIRNKYVKPHTHKLWRTMYGS